MIKRIFLPLSLVLWVGCSADNSDSPPAETDGNKDPHAVSCDTIVRSTCTHSSSCHTFYSDVASNAVRPDCQANGSPISAQECSSFFVGCCIRVDGSNGYPEGICVGQSDVADQKAFCDRNSMIWCER